MKKQWIAFILTAVGAVVVGLWIYRKINPAPSDTGIDTGFVNSLPDLTVASGGAGVQHATQQGITLSDSVSTITVGPATVKPAWDPNFGV